MRNGHARERRVTVGSGTLTVRAPRVNDERVVDGTRQKFTSEILPPYLRRSKAVSEVLPVLYLRGLSTGDFREGLAALLGKNATGLSPSTITRLTSSWQEEYRAWRTRPLADRDYVYVWADGVHFSVRLEDERLAALVVIGARPDGTKEVVALEDGYRESTESWLALLHDLKARGMRAPVVAVGDGAHGFWAALREVFPVTREKCSRCGCVSISPVRTVVVSSSIASTRGPIASCIFTIGGVGGRRPRRRSADGREPGQASPLPVAAGAFGSGESPPGVRCRG